MAWPWAGRYVGDLTVRALAYHTGVRRISGLLIRPDGGNDPYDLAGTADLLPVLDALADGLQRPADVARGRVRGLREFAERGRVLLPAELLADPPDVLVLVPHSILHGVPLHLVRTDSGDPLGTRCAVTYASSLSQFALCAGANPARARDLAAWPLPATPAGGPPRVVTGYCADVLDPRGERFAAVLAGIERALGQPLVAEGSRTSIKAHLEPANPVRPDAVVVVAHGWLDPEDHQLSGLLLSATDLVLRGYRATPAGRPLRLTAGQRLRVDFAEAPLAFPPAEFGIGRYAELMTIAELRLDAVSRVPLVALFGCSAGWSRVGKGDVPASLGEVFLSVGSAAVVAPAWDAEVGATAAWAEHFFHAWSGLGWPVALSGAYASRALYEDGVPMERYGALTTRGDWL